MAINFYINQSIFIQSFKVGGVSNSSVLQIGSVGMIKSQSRLMNSGGFLAPAPKFQSGNTVIEKPPTQE